MAETQPLLSVRDLVVEFGLDQGTIRALESVSLDLHPGRARGDLREGDGDRSRRAVPER